MKLWAEPEWNPFFAWYPIVYRDHVSKRRKLVWLITIRRRLAVDMDTHAISYEYTRHD